MRDDLLLPITLTLADCPTLLHVIGFSGSDALNEPYLFEVDVLCFDTTHDSATLLHSEAYLAFSAHGGGVHGRIAQVQDLHHGQRVNLYRLRLVPALQALAGHRASRSFNGMNAMQIITRLLQDHGMGGDSVRFQRVTGVYPVREHCLQFDETDLHLLQRLCEEEGIHFRFEHYPTRHVLIFSDDPCDFPELHPPVPVIAQAHKADSGAVAGLDHLAECLSVGTSYSTHLGKGPGELAPAWMFGAHREEHPADNQPLSYGNTAGVTAVTPRRSQTGVRRLERLRCERRQVVGLSNQPRLQSGQVMQVIGHPETLFNDQWLLTQVQHSGKQLQLLQGLADAAAIVRALAHPRLAAFEGLQAGYRNALRVIPWAMPFRAALSHPRPRVAGVQRARLTRLQADHLGRLRIRYDWQTTDVDRSGADSWARVSRSVLLTEHDCTVYVAFLDGDCDQPYICGVEPAAMEPPVSTAPTEGMSLRSHKAVSLRSAVSQLEVSAGRIRVSHNGEPATDMTDDCPDLSDA
jgi:type VI secretion system secreted protein VgrG